MAFQLLSRAAFGAALVVFCALISAPLAAAETTTDPNASGWRLNGENLDPVYWAAVAPRCPACAAAAKEYNAVMSELLRQRYRLRYVVQREAAEQERLLRRDVKPRPNATADTDFAAAAAVLDQGMNWGRLRDAVTARIRTLEAEANWLRRALYDCEQSRCVGDDAKKQAARVGGDGGPAAIPPQVPPPPHLVLNFDWKGPYPQVCHRCAKLAERLNELPAMARERLRKVSDMRAALAESGAEAALTDSIVGWMAGTGESTSGERLRNRASMTERIEQLEFELRRIKENFDATLALYDDCVKKCPKQVGACPTPPSHVAVAIGSRGEVGSGARMTQKLKETVGGMAGGALGGLLGGRAGGLFGGGGGSRDPETERDPVDNDDKVKVKSEGVELALGARFNGDGELVVSGTIGEDAPGYGTFHAVFAQDRDGRRLVPYRLDIYELWREWSLTVSWTYDRWVDGKHVEHKEGGWTERGRESKYFSVLTRGEAREASIWHRLGFENASHGVRSLGATFKIAKKDLAGGPINIVVHTTLPEKDPVMTVPMVFEIALKPGDDDKIVATPATVAVAERACPPAGSGAAAPAGGGGQPAVEAPKL